MSENITLAVEISRLLTKIEKEFHVLCNDKEGWNDRDVRNRLRFLHKAFKKTFDLANEEVYTRIFCVDEESADEERAENNSTSGFSLDA